MWSRVAVCLRLAGMLLVAALAVSSARAAEPSPEVLQRLAPSVVRVRAGEAHGSGFLYPSNRHVVTAYSVVNRSGRLLVGLANGEVFDAHVVAWSKTDDLAILELPIAVQAKPLELEATGTHSGARVVLLGYLHPEASDTPELSRLALPRFGNVSVVAPAWLGVDVARSPGDTGGPVATPEGRVIGVLSGSTSPYAIPSRAGTASRVAALGARIGRQGEFEADPPSRTSWGAGLFVTPLGSDHARGAGLDSYFVHDWFAVTVPLGFTRNELAPETPGSFEARSTVFLELHTLADIRGKDPITGAAGKYFLGPAVALNIDRNESRSLAPDGQTFIKEFDGEVRVRPLVILGVLSGVLSTRVAVDVLDVEARVDLGIAFGR